MVNLVAVQAELYLEHYASHEAFRKKFLTLTEEAVSGLPDVATLVAFPEAIGFPLLLTLDNTAALSHKKVGSTALDLARRNWQQLLGAAWYYRTPSLKAFYALRSLEAFKVYHDVFSEAARTFGVTIVAGSSFLPHVEKEATRGLHIADTGVRNVAFTFAPTGTLLGRTPKLYLNPGLESRVGLSCGLLGDLHAMQTPVGKLGVAICLDGFYGSVLDHLDGLGAQIVVQPSANHAPWERAWPGDSKLSEGEAWLTHGLRAQLQNRLHVQVGVNPMLVGDVWDLQPRGRSSIVVNGRYFPNRVLEGFAGVVALAETDDSEEIVKATLALKKPVAEVM